VMRELVGLPETEVLDCLDEAIGAGFLRVVDRSRETYDFTHAIVRDALSDQQNPSRAARLHRRAAEAIERAHAGHENHHAAELAVQYHGSASLPGAGQGIPHAIAAAEQARAAVAQGEAVAMLRIARDLAIDLDPGSRGSILCRLATAEAEALLLDDAERTAITAVAMLEAGEVAPERVASFLAALALALKVGGADGRSWRPLVERGMALVGPAPSLTRARLELLRDPVEPIPSDLLWAGRWRGFDPEAVAIMRRHGDEEDHARTLESFDVRTRDETKALIALARSWRRPPAVLWALTVAANDLQYRHGAFRDALTLWQELYATAERYGATFWQAQAMHQRLFLHLAFGHVEAARQVEATAEQLYARLGPRAGARTGTIAAEAAAAFALMLDGDWAEIAATLTAAATERPIGADDVGALGGFLWAALAALAHARAGATIKARRLIAALTRALEQVDVRRDNQNHNGVVAFTAEAIWILDAADLAEPYRVWAHRLADAGIGDYPQTSLALSWARLATLLGNHDEATSGFALARTTLEASGQRPPRIIVDYDEGLALLRPGRIDSERATDLLEGARYEFEALEMAGWMRRAGVALGKASAERDRAPYPAGLTERETDVLRLIARGHSDRQVADALFISPRTVNAHVRNMLAKTDATNRTELSVWALEQNIVTS